MVFQARIRKAVIALLVVLLVGAFIREAVAQMIPTPEVCKRTGPSDWEWWENWCWNYPSAAGYPQRGFLIVR
jgi:hypothetical protein